MVNAAAVKASLERSIAGPERYFSPGLADIASVSMVSEFEVAIRLGQRSTFLLDNLTVFITKNTDGKNQVGTGPFLTTSTADGEVRMTAVNNYYKGRSKIDQIVIRTYPAVRSAWAAMMRGDIDFLYEVGPEAFQFVSGESSVNLFPFLRSYALGVILNVQRPNFRDSRVRRAMNYAIDRTTIVEHALRGHGIPASGSAWPQHWAYDPNIETLNFDVSKATALLDTTNLKVTRNTDRAPSRFRFTCIIPENFALWERLGLHVQRNLASVGIDMQLEVLPVTEFNRRIAAADFDAVLTEFVVGNSPSRPYFFWHSQSKQNVSGYANRRMDDALDGIRRASSDEEYRHAFRQFQVETIDEPPAIFLALTESARAVNKRFHVIAPTGSDILPTIAEWTPAQSTGAAN